MKETPQEKIIRIRKEAIDENLRLSSKVIYAPPNTQSKIEDWRKRFDEEFEDENKLTYVGDLLQYENENGDIVFVIDDIKSFIESVETQAIKAERERIVGIIEDYFEGLIAIPNPQLTKKRLISDIKNKLK